MSDAPGEDRFAPYPSHYFQRYDRADDALFYAFPRKVVHIDEGAIAALGTVYAEVLPRAGVLLDLMSSWRTHLPSDLAEASALEVVGLGLNAEELADNPQLSQYVVHDVNREPRLPFPDAAFDGGICAVSVQYMTRPVELFADVARVLKPGASFLVSFSNRCFPTKAVAIWHNTTDDRHIELVGSYFQMSGQWGPPDVRRFTPPAGDPLYVVWAARS